MYYLKNTFTARSGLVFVTGYRDLAAYIHTHTALSWALPALLHHVSNASLLGIPQPDVLLPPGLCSCGPLCLDLFPDVDAEHGSVLCFLHGPIALTCTLVRIARIHSTYDLT